MPQNFRADRPHEDSSHAAKPATSDDDEMRVGGSVNRARIVEYSVPNRPEQSPTDPATRAQHQQVCCGGGSDQRVDRMVANGHHVDMDVGVLPSTSRDEDAVVICTRPEIAEAATRECADLSITHVWMHRGPGAGSVSPTAAAYGRE